MLGLVLSYLGRRLSPPALDSRLKEAGYRTITSTTRFTAPVQVVSGKDRKVLEIEGVLRVPLCLHPWIGSILRQLVFHLHLLIQEVYQQPPSPDPLPDQQRLYHQVWEQIERFSQEAHWFFSTLEWNQNGERN